MSASLSHTVALFAVASLVAILARRLRSPYTVGLVLVGLVLAFLHITTGVTLTRYFIFQVILPPLLFEAAINIRWEELRRDALLVLTLATVGVLISAFVVGSGMHLFVGWPWPSALIFGIITATTDPVAVIAMLKETNVAGRLRLLVECESLLNDGVAAVLFVVAVAWTQAGGGHSLGPSAIASTLALTVGGGIIVGVAVGGLGILIAGRTTDHLIETQLTTIAAYGSFLLADHLNMSGILATVAAGLVMGNISVLKTAAVENPITERGRAFVLDFWEFIAFLANSLIFLLIGLRLASISFGSVGALTIVSAITLLLIGRLLSVYPLCFLFCRTRWRVPINYQHILWWGGLRGALALALCLSLPATVAMRDQIVVSTFAIVAFSIMTQGLTMPKLLKKESLLENPI